ncbi:Asp-tRNA(Asn)/Glu-tRNA(Gln) amidotransferase subunit GatC [Amphritea sp. 2_MG-2023]|jgi:aspartyl-tRNA(Asn)/glutamyl-tRNA(Gln) amidotransferase subunit C|uniref:Asp-tRNA(Asn)/Glu-tRNA(Gln) amidotransferase subunit GatC n=1 Tax=Amphritea TaxID=515417 RepID=UPI001C070548|nr:MULTISPECIES: Asp-tRNA(Asn)/Glu-tRNA(Gln) amidotransferase subunit GatC [Amphritea]MBU2966137.1 Asp-tRNA(Asn)/Glu-tRNA(Gln) amidotransferase subunit GatC [Amphritea atlantica]MDO6418208.1 Asp-tRNA(Asn)/Glu-tRNA(Gln) amidotransferase subunit GatC [Amphritea sp. 2_MG-2023]MDX2422730.1 Asp-tRNA(Asn)/Glu-tRNA(Gln) amidotransferase subunit GatC [Amphritea sp.]
MSLDRTDVEKIAHLARLNIAEQDIQEYAENLSNILDLVDQMQAVDTQDITPMAHPMDAIQRLRLDEVTEGNQRDLLQTVAPAVEAGLFQVPKVIE